MFSDNPGTQGEFIQKYNEFAELIDMEKLNKDGVCYGLSVVYLDYAKKNELDEFFAIKRIISSLSMNDIQKLAQYYRLYYIAGKTSDDFLVKSDEDEFSYYQILDFIDRINLTQKEQNRHPFLHTDLSWEETQLISNNDNPDAFTLANALSSTDSQFLKLGDRYHACSIVKTEEGLYFFDPNVGEHKLFKTANELQRKLYHPSKFTLDSRFLTMNSLTEFFVLQGLSIATIDPIVDDLIEKAKIKFKDDPDWKVDMETALANYRLGNLSNKTLFGSFLDFLEKKSGTQIKTTIDALDQIRTILAYDFDKEKIEKLQIYLNYYFQQKNNLEKFFSNLNLLKDKSLEKKEKAKKIFEFLINLTNVKDGILLKAFIEYLSRNNIKFNINRKFKITMEEWVQKRSLLEISVEIGSVSCIDSLIKCGAEIEDLNTLLITAAKYGQVQIFEYFSKEFDEKKWPIDEIIEYAILEGHIDVVKFFLPKHKELVTNIINNYRDEGIRSNTAYRALEQQKNAKILYDLQNLGCVIEDDFKVQLFKMTALTKPQAAASMIEYDPKILQLTLETTSPEKLISTITAGGSWEILWQIDLTQISEEEIHKNIMRVLRWQKWECAAILMAALDKKQVPRELSTSQKALIVDAYLKLLKTLLNKHGLSDIIYAKVTSMRDGENGLSSLFRQKESMLETFWSSNNKSVGSQSRLTRRLVRLEELVTQYSPQGIHLTQNTKK